MNNTITEGVTALHSALDEKIEEFIREANVIMRECLHSTEEGTSLIEMEGKNLLSKIKQLDELIPPPYEGRNEEIYNLYFTTLSEAQDEYFIKGYLVGRLGIQEGHNPYNWQYLANKFVEVKGRQETQEKEGQS